MTTKHIQLEADKRLLYFKTYEDYLDSLVSPIDLHYLRSTSTARKIAELGYRNTNDVLDQDTFYRRQKNIKNHLFPTTKPCIQDSAVLIPRNHLQIELSQREQSNRLGIISTIIFVQLIKNSTPIISGYIDFSDRLRKESWRNFFLNKNKQIILPRNSDLAYYNWKSGLTKFNVTENYQWHIDRARGLIFKNIHDRKFIFIDPNNSQLNVNTTRLWLKDDSSSVYIVIYDHIVRNRG